MSSAFVITDAELGYRTGLLGTHWNSVLRHVHMHVDGCAVLLGPNGSGKTTLLNAAIGFLEPRTGSVSLKGKHPRKCVVSTLPQTTEVLPWRTALEDAALFMEIVGIPLQARQDRAAKMLDTLCFDGQMHARNWRLSGGQKQKVALARCLCMAEMADMLVLDEPTNFLDDKSRENLNRVLPSILASASRPVLVATHDLALASAIAGEHLRIADGTLKRCIQ